MIYFIAYIILMFVFAGIFYVFDDSKEDYWLLQSFFWPLTLLFLFGTKIGEKLK